MKRQIPAAAIIAALAACSSTPESEPKNALDATPSRPAAAAHMPPSRNTSAPETTASRRDPAMTSMAAPSQRSIYFEYDSNVVKDEFSPVVQANARYLAAQRDSRVTVQGNTDERGSREYNLALGQRRAEAVKQRMTILGVPAQRIETVSFGEEKPRAEADNEQAYAENRRADIVYGR